MQTEQILDITRQAMRLAVLLAAPLLIFGLVVGVLMNVLQAVTQITETTLAVVPKMAAMLLALIIFSPWMLDLLVDFTTQLYESIPTMVR
ncbi:MAG: flagellar biosynthesis protein FliQ [Bdellovibrionales bacterium]|nr:flagellar biosynthesis protein FliQ [Pseudomonadota bacterium]MSP18196.1 flagellar biosynthesis protein FliQ [Bdellovibrionales bacterium]NQW44010.1 flagellar biosynthesis protein FliQ [Deltaproteobacteria bacterium]